jgi:hypothetical protein
MDALDAKVCLCGLPSLWKIATSSAVQMIPTQPRTLDRLEYFSLSPYTFFQCSCLFAQLHLQRDCDLVSLCYQTLHEFTGYRGVPLAHPKALPNSSKFWMAPLTRERPGDCGSLAAD